MKRPPYGKAIAERLRYNNPPLCAFVCIGGNAWTRAKSWNQLEARAMVLPPAINPQNLLWPVSDIPVVIDADIGPSEQQVSDLALTLLKAGSLPVTCISENKTHPFRQYRWNQ